MITPYAVKGSRCLLNLQSDVAASSVAGWEVSKAQYPGHVWSYNFIFERAEDGKTLKFLTIVDGIQPGCPIAAVRAFSDWTSRHQDAIDVAPRLGSNGLLAQ